MRGWRVALASLVLVSLGAGFSVGEEVPEAVPETAWDEAEPLSGRPVQALLLGSEDGSVVLLT